MREDSTMRRSAVGFMVTLTLSMLVVPCVAAPPVHIPTVGWLDQGGWADKAHLHRVFLQGLRELNYVEGQNLVMVRRDAEGQLDRLPALAAELVQLVAYLLAADTYSRSLASRLIGVNQPVIRTRNGFSTLHPTQLVCI
jgi:hypothetical protein